MAFLSRQDIKNRLRGKGSENGVELLILKDATLVNNLMTEARHVMQDHLIRGKEKLKHEMYIEDSRNAELLTAQLLAVLICRLETLKLSLKEALSRMKNTRKISEEL